MQTARGGGGGSGFLFAPSAIIKGTLFSLGVALLASLLLSLVVTLADWNNFPPSLLSFHYISIGLGGVLAARSSRRFGWLHGGIVGVIYTLTISILFTDGLASNMFMSPEWLSQALWGFLAGVAGGVLGVNASS